MAREVCFQLVDVEGNAGTAVDCVDCADDEADVIDLRDAVKVKYGDSFLADIAASDLRVFKNWAAYDAKQQLQPSSLLTDLGKDEDDALIVQVPKGTTSMSSHSFYSSFLKPSDKNQALKKDVALWVDYLT
ncbi:hypothetical protein V7S43_007135 [Phytophthora oleae]|uniref:Ubiquitin-like domain-containing protein n=1 Tax=Phytophthora oleae TaxID=2107226 RepID=A0ABD3FM91_9STRA